MPIRAFATGGSRSNGSSASMGEPKHLCIQVPYFVLHFAVFGPRGIRHLRKCSVPAVFDACRDGKMMWWPVGALTEIPW